MLKNRQIFFLFVIFHASLLNASIQDFINPYSNPSYSDYGTIGLITIPTARMQEQGTIGFTWSRNEPYMRGGIIAYPFKFLEAQYKYTDINDQLYSRSVRFSGKQSLKDKGFDIKLRLIEETKFLPEISFGFRDFGGTNRFQSEYLVFSKYYGNFDITAGIGWGVMNDGLEIKNPLTSLAERFETRDFIGGRGGKFSVDQWISGKYASLFGGFEYFIPRTRSHRLKFEIDPNNYRDTSKLLEGRRPIKQKSKYNFGYVLPINDDLFLSLSWIRGNTLQFGFSFSHNYGQKDSFIKKTERYRTVKDNDIVKKVTERDKSLLYRASLRYLNERDLYMQGAELSDDNSYHVVYSQNKFLSYPRASGRVLRVLDEIAPTNINKLIVTNLNASFAANTIEINRKAYKKALVNDDFNSLTKDLKIYQTNKKLSEFEYAPLAKFPIYSYSLQPAIRSHIGGPDGFALGQIWLRADGRITFNRKLSVTGIFGYGIADTFDQLKQKSDSVLPRVRTEIVKYLKQGTDKNIVRLQANYVDQLKKGHYYRFSAGIFEEMFSGYGFEYMYRPFNRNYALGIEAFHAFKRSYEQTFELLDYETVTGHATFYFMEPKSQVLFKISGGRYLAEDSGLTFDFSRRFKSGLNVGAFFSLTDVSEDEFGEGSFDKGFYFNLPLEAFFTNYSKQLTNFGLRPITRDGAAKLITGSSLWGITDMSTRHSIIRDKDDFFD